MNATHKKSLLPVYIKGLCSGTYTLKQASQSTGYTENWLCILKHKYLRDGVSCLEHKNKNRVPVNKTPEKLCRGFCRCQFFLLSQISCRTARDKNIKTNLKKSALGIRFKIARGTSYKKIKESKTPTVATCE